MGSSAPPTAGSSAGTFNAPTNGVRASPKGRGASGSAKIGASMFACGALVTAAAMIAPHSAETEVAGFWWLFAAQVAVAGLLLVLPRSVGVGWIPGAIVALSIATVSAALYFNGERRGGPSTLNEFYYVWPALYVGYFFKRRGLFIAVGLIAAAYGGMLVAVHADANAAITRWMVTVSVAGGSALALQSIRRRVDQLVVRLRELARTDPLTGLSNRREFEERFEAELDLAQRTGEPCVLALGDIDFFKRLNDIHGHQAGDQALQAVAKAIAGATRVGDTTARIGGEEFAVLLPRTTALEASPVVERLREQIAKVTTAAGEPLSISFGLAEFPEHGRAMGDLMHAADVALYTAKAVGRDRILIGGDERLRAAVS